MKRVKLVDLVEAVKGLQLEVSTLRAELSPRRRKVQTARATVNATEAAEILGMDRKTFYRRNLGALLVAAPVGRGYTRRSVEALRAKMEGTRV